MPYKQDPGLFLGISLFLKLDLKSRDFFSPVAALWETLESCCNDLAQDKATSFVPVVEYIFKCFSPVATSTVFASISHINRDVENEAQSIQRNEQLIEAFRLMSSTFFSHAKGLILEYFPLADLWVSFKCFKPDLKLDISW